MTLDGKTAIVTGGARGIGAALCYQLGISGAQVAVLDVESDPLEQTIANLRREGISATGIICDVTSRQSCQDAVDTVNQKFGGIDILCNNAGITQIGRFLENTPEVYRHVMEVNFFGSVNMTQAAMKSLIERRGMIEVTSSIAGFAPLMGRTGYCASKHALHGFFDVLRVELAAAGVHVLIVCPGYTQTSIKNLSSDGSQSSKPRAIKGTMATPENVAARIYTAIIRRKRVAVLTLAGKVTWYLSRFFPRFYDRLMVKSVINASPRA